MEPKKVNIWNLDVDFEQQCDKKVWDNFFGLNAHNNMPEALVEKIGITRQEATEIMANFFFESNSNLEQRFEKMINNFWTSLESEIDSEDYAKAKSIEYFINAYLIHGLENGFNFIKNQINLDAFVKTDWLDINCICAKVEKEMDANFKNQLVKSLICAIEVANYDTGDMESLKSKIILLTSDLNTFYTKVCGISESIINNHGLVSIDVIDNTITLTYQNNQKVSSVYNITNNLVTSLSLKLKNEINE